jgi:superfamily I DNA and/or RNA helicase
MERLLQQAANQPTLARQLDLQYRMHQQIMAFSSQTFYGDTLVAHPTVATHLLCDLPGITESDLTATPVALIDTAGADHNEALEPDGESRFNEGEVQVVQRKVEQLCEAGLAPAQISIIAPYSAQVRLLRDRLKTQVEQGLEIGSIDGFQGRENEVVIISLVRSNDTGEIGFLADTRRMNVALTRARRKLIVIGDSATIANHPFYADLLTYFDRIGAYHTVWEEAW